MTSRKIHPQPVEENNPKQNKENSKIKQNLIYIGFFALIIFGFYYFMSLYQNCIRDVNEILSSKFKRFCVPLDNFLIRETLPIIKNCDISICNDSSFSHLSAALGIKTITLMADTPLIYGSYSSRMFPIIPEGENTVTHNTLGKDKISPQKIFDKVIEIIN